MTWIERVKELTHDISTSNCTSQERLQYSFELKKILMAIRDRIIGNSCCKYFFVRNGFLQVLTPLLWMKDESSAEFTQVLTDCQRDALTLLSVLIGQIGGDTSVVGGDELFTNLLALLRTSSPSVDIKFLEILTRSLCCFARKVESSRGAVFDASTLSVLLSYLDSSSSSCCTTSSSVVVQNICGVLAACCDGEGKSRVLLSARTLPMLLSLLAGSICVAGDTPISAKSSLRIGITDLRCLDGSVELLCTLTRDCQEACEAVAQAPMAGRRIPNILFSLLNVSLLSIELRLKITLL